MYSDSMTIDRFDPELARAIAGERQRQEDHIELIASENYASPRVLEAQGSRRDMEPGDGTSADKARSSVGSSVGK